MVKGVNKMVLDLPQPESESFERVLFFVRPEAAGKSETALEGAAKTLLEKESAVPPKSARRPGRVLILLTHFLAACAGAGVAAILAAMIR